MLLTAAEGEVNILRCVATMNIYFQSERRLLLCELGTGPS